MGVNNLPKVVTQQRGGQGSNSHQSDALAMLEHCALNALTI